MTGREERADVIDLIYEAAVDASLWRPVMNRLADLCGAASAHLLSQDFKTFRVSNIAPGSDPEKVRVYAEHWAHQNPHNDAWTRAPIGSVVSYDTLIPRQDFTRTAFYNEFLVPAGMAEGLGSCLLAEESVLASLTLYRPAHRGRFDWRQADLLASLIPHLQRALRLNFRLADIDMRRTASAELLDRLSQACVLVDAEARVLFANRGAEGIFNDRVGLHRRADGTLYNGQQAETSRLHRLIASAAQRGGSGSETGGDRLRLPRGDSRAPLVVLVIPLRAATDWLAPRCPAAILFINDPERTNNPSAERLQQMFGLTRAEAAVALQVLNGHGLQAAAAALGVSPITVRTHLSAVFGKTGTHRQAELVRVLAQNESGIRDG